MIRDLFRWFGVIVAVVLAYLLITIGFPSWLGESSGSFIAAAIGVVLLGYTLLTFWRRRDR
jgi:hypothetical protein